MNARQISEAISAMREARVFIAQSALPHDGKMIGVVTELAHSETVLRLELADIPVSITKESEIA